LNLSGAGLKLESPESWKKVEHRVRESLVSMITHCSRKALLHRRITAQTISLEENDSPSRGLSGGRFVTLSLTPAAFCGHGCACLAPERRGDIGLADILERRPRGTPPDLSLSPVLPAPGPRQNVDCSPVLLPLRLSWISPTTQIEPCAERSDIKHDLTQQPHNSSHVRRRQETADKPQRGNTGRRSKLPLIT
jgi:hypothetical protein